MNYFQDLRLGILAIKYWAATQEIAILIPLSDIEFFHNIQLKFFSIKALIANLLRLTHFKPENPTSIF